MIQTDFEKGLQLGLIGYIPSDEHEILIEGKIELVKFNQLVIFCYDSIEHETEKAYKIKRENLFYWMPKSRIFNNSSENFKEFKEVNYFVTDTFLFDKLTPINLSSPRKFNNDIAPDVVFGGINMSDGFESDFYNDQLDMDQQSPEFWDNL